MPLDHVSSLIRASIFVQHIDRAADFYAVLGFTDVYYDGTLDNPSASSVLGLAVHHPYRVKIVKQPGPNYGMIGLFQLAPDAAPEALPAPAGPARRGEVALVFYVRSMADTLAALRAAGASWSPEPELFTMAHRAQLEVCLRDCDGVFLNLVETDPAEQNRTTREG
jgi:catechol 2,3-dioxygenase-like lactoylglutathione lyase family enzyme